MFLFVLASIVCVSVCSPRVGVVCSLVWLCGVFVCLCVFVCCFVVLVCSFCFLFMLVLRSCCFEASSFQLLQCIVSMRTIHLFVDFHCFVDLVELIDLPKSGQLVLQDWSKRARTRLSVLNALSELTRTMVVN